MKNKDQGLLSWKDEDIYSLSGRKQMKEQWKERSRDTLRKSKDSVLSKLCTP